MKASKAAKNAQAVFKKDMDAKKATLKTKSDKVAALDKELKGLDQKSNAWKEKRDKLAKEFKELKTIENKMNQELRKEDMDLIACSVVSLQE
ncbi:hypothetical protein ER57_03420 [Smithella sp. SCADC]|jgi:seryl-tRNA synthetase|nr:hypothetical protein ER57_03420 [Smithella sp. SCADC]